MIEATSSMVFSDDVIRRFLLGELTVAEQGAFENRLVADDELESRVRLGELRLADDYAQRCLTRDESLRVQERFLVTRDRQHMAAVSQALHDRFAPATNRIASGIFNLNHPAWRYAFAAIILIIVFATVWLRVKERRLALNPPTPPKRVAPKASPTQSPVVAHHPIGSSAPTHQEEPTPPLEHQTTLSIALDAKNTVENPFELKLTDRATSIRAVVSVEKNDRDSYRVDIWNSRGESVLSADGLTPSEEGKLVIDIPALDLSPGEYMIRLNGREDEPGLQYYFRIIR
jgi:hypothetical protein